MLSGSHANIKFVLQITKQKYLREIKSVCLVSLVLGKGGF